MLHADIESRTYGILSTASA